MRTIHLSAAAATTAAAIAASFLIASPVTAQRNVRRASAHSAMASSRSARGSGNATGQARSAARRCAPQCGDYSLAVVSALLPARIAGASAAATPELVTLVIENRGTALAPASVISVAPRQHVTLARQTSIPSLAPGERTTIQLPVEAGPDGAECISMTITPAPVADPATARFLASAAPVVPELGAAPDVWGARGWAGLMGWNDFAPYSDFTFPEGFGGLGDW
jgi:hypothetical protein